MLQKRIKNETFFLKTFKLFWIFFKLFHYVLHHGVKFKRILPFYYCDDSSCCILLPVQTALLGRFYLAVKSILTLKLIFLSSHFAHKILRYLIHQDVLNLFETLLFQEWGGGKEYTIHKNIVLYGFMKICFVSHDKIKHGERKERYASCLHS